MAPQPENDKEPKAPDKSGANSNEDIKTFHNLLTVNDQQTNTENKLITTAANVESEEHVEGLDDGQLRALLDEAFTYKCPKDREGKSKMFKELLKEVEQDEQACSAMCARSWGRGTAGRARRGRRALPHSTSMQDLAAALAAEPAPRRRPPPVSSRTHHGGSLPSGVDRSFLLGEEPVRGAEYVATVRCVNPSPLAERRVSASDAEPDLLNKRSKMPALSVTYTARATLEIGSGSVCSGRAVTTTTASKQVRTRPLARSSLHHIGNCSTSHTFTTPPLDQQRHPEETSNKQQKLKRLPTDNLQLNKSQEKLLSALKSIVTMDASEGLCDGDSPSDYNIEITAGNASPEGVRVVNLDSNARPRGSRVLFNSRTKKPLPITKNNNFNRKGNENIEKNFYRSNNSHHLNNTYTRRKDQQVPAVPIFIPPEPRYFNYNVNKKRDPRKSNANFAYKNNLSLSSPTKVQNHLDPRFNIFEESSKIADPLQLWNKSLNRHSLFPPSNIIAGRGRGFPPMSPTKSDNYDYKQLKNISHKLDRYPGPYLKNKHKNEFYRRDIVTPNWIEINDREDQKLMQIKCDDLLSTNEGRVHISNYTANRNYGNLHDDKNATIYSNINRNKAISINKSDGNSLIQPIIQSHIVNSKKGIACQHKCDKNKTVKLKDRKNKEEDLNITLLQHCHNENTTRSITDYIKIDPVNIENNSQLSKDCQENMELGNTYKFSKTMNASIDPSKAVLDPDKKYVVDKNKIENDFVNSTIMIASEDITHLDNNNDNKEDTKEIAIIEKPFIDVKSVSDENILFKYEDYDVPCAIFLDNASSDSCDSLNSDVQLESIDHSDINGAVIFYPNVNLSDASICNVSTINYNLSCQETKCIPNDNLVDNNTLCNYKIAKKNEIYVEGALDKVTLSNGQNTLQSDFRISFDYDTNVEVPENISDVMINKNDCNDIEDSIRVCHILNFVIESENAKHSLKELEVNTNQEQRNAHNDNIDKSKEKQRNDPIGNIDESTEEQKNDPIGNIDESTEEQRNDPIGNVDKSTEKQRNDPNGNIDKSTEEQKNDPIGNIDESTEEQNNDPIGNLDEPTSIKSHHCQLTTPTITEHDNGAINLVAKNISDELVDENYSNDTECTTLKYFANNSCIKYEEIKKSDTKGEVHCIEEVILENSNYATIINDVNKMPPSKNISEVINVVENSRLTDSINEKAEGIMCSPEHQYKEVEDNSNITTEDIQEIVNQESCSESTSPLEIVNEQQGLISSMNYDLSSINGDQFILAELSNNAFIFLRMPNSSNDQTIALNTLLNNVNAVTMTAASKLIKPNKCTNKEETDAKRYTKLTEDSKLFLSDNIKSTNKPGIILQMPSKTAMASKEVDSSIPFSCITTPEVVSSCNTTSSLSQSAVAVDPKPRSVIANSFSGMPLTRSNYGSASITASEDKFQKSLDENANSVQGYNSPHSGSSQIKKNRKKKTSKNETVINIDKMEGYQGNKDLNELLRFIESDADNSRSQKLRMHTKHKDDTEDKSSKKRSTERRTKDKENKMKRANSMEELSRTKLEDLTDKPDTTMRKNKKDRWTDGASSQSSHKSERRSWGDDSTETFFYVSKEEESPIVTVPPLPKEKKKAKMSKSIDSTPSVAQDLHSDTGIELMDFKTVTKKKKPRKRFEDNDRESVGGDLSFRKNRPATPERRRKSAPPSDKSNDSNDDMDSVHSLPAEPTNERTAPRSHVSYADIARTRHNIPDLIESCNFYMDVDQTIEMEDHKQKDIQIDSSIDKRQINQLVNDSLVSSYHVEGYPALECRNQRPKGKETKMSPPNKRIERKTKCTTEVIEEKPSQAKTSKVFLELEMVELEQNGSPPDVVADRRPPVILLDEAAQPRDLEGVTFGFDINEQLLKGSASGSARRRCDLVRETLGGALRSLQYMPPVAQNINHHLNEIVHYVESAWEDIIRCSNGKVRYFSE